LRSWSDCHGDLESRFPRDDILDLLTIYWATQSAPSSLRSYYERVHFDAPLGADEHIPAPVAVTVPIDRPGQPPHWAPRSLAERMFDVRQWTDLPSGGHFASWEEAEAVATAMRGFFDSLPGADATPHRAGR
ncbi:MAG: epoxide hydrolase, partial [Myxococcales bacterium]|nr:epoxide hydrolase [Myxococcales bacterium]